MVEDFVIFRRPSSLPPLELRLSCASSPLPLNRKKAIHFQFPIPIFQNFKFRVLFFFLFLFTWNLNWNEYSWPRIHTVRMEGQKISIDIPRNGKSKVLDPLFTAFLVQLPHKLQNCLKSQLKRLAKEGDKIKPVNYFLEKKNRSSSGLRIDREKQLQAWRGNPSWVNPPPEIEVSVAKGSLCHLKATVDVGLPPDEVYNIVTDPDNRRVFKNVKEVISRKVLIDEGQRQVVEVEQSAMWRFLWWSGTISVHVLVDQNREDHSMRFKQMSNGFMKIFEGYWRVEPLFVDEKICFPFKPKTWAEYCSCTGGKGRIGSKVSLDQLIQPAIAPPPPISWYLSGIPAKTTEMLINDLLAEADRIKGSRDSESLDKELWLSKKINEHHYQLEQGYDIKERWKSHRRNRKLLRRRKKLSIDESLMF